jgi:DNA-directed RNA polymerase specialized sigma24 family protein
MATGQKTGSSSFKDARFTTTHWSVVLSAKTPSSPDYQRALSTLCETYWFPIYAFLRRQGYNAHKAEEQTQGFFAHMIEMKDLCRADPGRGRFRSFLLSMLKHFMADLRDHAQAQKRGGGKKTLSLDFTDAESRYKLEPVNELSPDKLFEKSWALTLLCQTMTRLKNEAANTNKQKLFEQLKAHMAGHSHAVPYRELAGQLEMTEGSVKIAMHRLKKRYQELLREQIAATVSDPDEIDDEIRSLFVALTS